MPLKTAYFPSVSLKSYGRGCLSDTWMRVLKQRLSLCLDAANLEVEEVWQKREMRNKRRALLFRHNSACPAQSVYCWKREGRATFRRSCRSSAIIEELGRKVSLGLIRFMRAEGASEWRSTKVRWEVWCQEHEKGLLASRVGLLTVLSCELSLYEYILKQL